MDERTAKTEMFVGSWIVAACVGVLASAMLWLLGGWSFMQGAFMGAVVFVFAGVLVSWLMASPMSGPLEVKTAPKSAPQAEAAKPASAKAAAAASVATQAEPVAASKPAAKPAQKPAAKKAKAAAPSASDPRPAVLSDAPRAGGADDLKLISGVGPKLEQTLNELGVWHFDQVAAFQKNDIEWVDARLRFKGRIERDDWMSQARVLADGGETEFSKKKSKG